MSRRHDGVPRRRWVGMTVEASRVLPYGACDAHRAYKAKRAARLAVRRHVDAFLAGELRCWKCWRGMTLHVFRCTLGRQDHWHKGHMWRNAAVAPSE